MLVLCNFYHRCIVDAEWWHFSLSVKGPHTNWIFTSNSATRPNTCVLHSNCIVEMKQQCKNYSTFLLPLSFQNLSKSSTACPKPNLLSLPPDALGEVIPCRVWTQAEPRPPIRQRDNEGAEMVERTQDSIFWGSKHIHSIPGNAQEKCLARAANVEERGLH